jgi:surface polysaccharide O-acyltransferase-like enzyme
MERRNSNTLNSKISLYMILLYLVLSVFSALVFSMLFRRSVTKGNKGIGWLLLTILSVLFYGTIAISLIKTSSPNHDAGYFWLGVVTVCSNILALILLVLKLIKRK